MKGGKKKEGKEPGIRTKPEKKKRKNPTFFMIAWGGETSGLIIREKKGRMPLFLYLNMCTERE